MLSLKNDDNMKQIWKVPLVHLETRNSIGYSIQFSRHTQAKSPRVKFTENFSRERSVKSEIHVNFLFMWISREFGNAIFLIPKKSITARMVPKKNKQCIQFILFLFMGIYTLNSFFLLSSIVLKWNINKCTI